MAEKYHQIQNAVLAVTSIVSLVRQEAASRHGSFCFSDCAAILLCTFLVLFPKGGVKLGPVPLTWGYLLMGLTAVLAIPFGLLSGSVLRIPRLTLVALAAAAPFQAVLLYAFLANGVRDWGFAISDIVTFVFLPVIMLLLFKPWIDRLNWLALLTLLRWYILAAAVYGLLLFVLRITTGALIEIPYLTVNAGDYGVIESEKAINRGGSLLKLISTYNNGNVYGVSMIILLPLFDLVERRRWRKAVLRLALVLTLSRTVWIGLVLDQVFTLAAHLWADFRSVPLVRLKNSVKAALLLVPVCGLLVVGLRMMSQTLLFLLDPSFGGRAEQFQAFSTIRVLPPLPIADINEVVYASILKSFGLTGFVSFVALMASPLLIAGIDRNVAASPIRLASLKGMLLYAVIAWADGAINLIPVMAFYWFTMLILIYGDRILPVRNSRKDLCTPC